MPTESTCNKISLRLLLVTGETSTFLFEPSITSKEIIRHVYTNWPVEWEERTVDHPQFLQLLYQGKFLSQSTTLSDLSLPHNKSIVMHLIVRANAPQEETQDQSRPSRKTNDRTQSCCTIL